MVDNELPLGIYLHFPYCRSRCPYCDFFKKLPPKDFDEEAIVARYIADMERFKDICKGRMVQSIFFGGGTPSILSERAIEHILNEISKRYKLNNETEISLEANPNTFEKNKFKGFAKAGINRLSLGVQALNNQRLKFLGRTHSLTDAQAAIEVGISSFPKFSFDLIYATPEQSWMTWQQELDMALNYGLKHISLYELSIEDGTPFAKKNLVAMPEDDAAKMYTDTVNYLRANGYERYEVSNFSLDNNNQCQHNLIYWRGGDYLGLGDGAHGRLHINDEIFATLDGNIVEKISAHERAEELTIMGLRLSNGIKEKYFKADCGLNFCDFFDILSIKMLADLKLICYSGDEIKLTDQGFLVLDKVLIELLTIRSKY